MFFTCLIEFTDIKCPVETKLHELYASAVYSGKRFGVCLLKIFSTFTEYEYAVCTLSLRLNQLILA